MIAGIQRDALHDRDEIKEAITVFDKDTKGFLTREQVENIVKNIGEEITESEIFQILDSMQYDEEGKITVDKLLATVFNDWFIEQQ